MMDKPYQIFKLLINSALVVVFLISGMFSIINAQTTNLSTSNINGKIIKLNGNDITVDLGNDTKQFSVTGDTKITRDNSDVKVSDLKVNDQVSVKTDQNGNVLTISSNADKSLLVLFLPLIVIIATIGCIGYLSLKKSQKGKIKTSVENLNN